MWNYIQTPIGYINFFTTHLAYLPEHNDIRVQQVQEIKDFIELKENTWSGKGSVLVGDFNCTPGSEPIGELTNPESGIGFVDAYKYTNPNLSGFTYPSDNPERRIDFNFIKNNSLLSVDTSFTIITESYDGEHYPSDHLGVMTIISASSETLSLNENTDNGIPAGFKLYSPYPNPFNLRTTVQFTIEKRQNISLKIYNVSGQLVETLLNGVVEVGNYRVVWNGLDKKGRLAATGMYFFETKMKGYSQTKLGLLLK